MEGVNGGVIVEGVGLVVAFAEAATGQEEFRQQNLIGVGEGGGSGLGGLPQRIGGQAGAGGGLGVGREGG